MYVAITKSNTQGHRVAGGAQGDVGGTGAHRPGSLGSSRGSMHQLPGAQGNVAGAGAHHPASCRVLLVPHIWVEAPRFDLKTLIISVLAGREGKAKQAGLGPHIDSDKRRRTRRQMQVGQEKSRAKSKRACGTLGNRVIRQRDFKSIC